LTGKIAIVGAGGQLGQELAGVLPGEIVGLRRADADLTRPDSLAVVLSEIRADIIINCAAYNFVDRAEDEPDLAMAVNAGGVRALATICRDLGSVLVHFSTDYVFGADTSRRTPYTEADAPDPVSVYARSKRAGEDFVRTVCEQYFVIRTCGLYGTRGQGGKGGNFVEAIRKRGTSGPPLRVVNDQRCTPTATADLARAVMALVGTEAYGLYHITNAGSCTWFEFAQAIVREAGLDAQVTPIASADYAAKAERPAYSVLDCSKYARLGLAPMRPWPEALRDYLAITRGPAS
jgi:dTDP-4-dehydrorhamnose reductase